MCIGSVGAAVPCPRDDLVDAVEQSLSVFLGELL